MVVSVKLGRLAFLPPVRIRLTIERQPDLPASPILVLRMVLEGVAALAGPVLRFLEGLPPGVRLEKDRLYIDLATLLRHYGAEAALSFVTALEADHGCRAGHRLRPARAPATRAVVVQASDWRLESGIVEM